MRATGRCLTVMIAICAWIAISNHCVLTAVGTKPPTNSDGCPFHSKPAKSPKPTATTCCKILRAVSNAPAKNLARSVVDLPNVDPAFSKLTFFVTPKISFVPEALDTGPPGKTAFAELNRSMRAHAPPVLS